MAKDELKYAYILEFLGDKKNEKVLKDLYVKSKAAAVNIIENAKLYVATVYIAENKPERALVYGDISSIQNSYYKVKNMLKNEILVRNVSRKHNVVEDLLYSNFVPEKMREKRSFEDVKKIEGLVELIEHYRKNKFASNYDYVAMRVAKNIAHTVVADERLENENLTFRALKNMINELMNEDLEELDYVAAADKELLPIYQAKQAEKLKAKEAEKAAKEERIAKIKAKKAKIDDFSKMLTLYDVANFRYNSMLNNAAEDYKNLSEKQKRDCGIINSNLKKITNRVDKLKISPYSLLKVDEDENILCDEKGFYIVDKNIDKKVFDEAIDKFLKAMKDSSATNEYYQILDASESLKKNYAPTQIPSEWKI